MMSEIETEGWKHFSQTFHVKKKRNLLQKFIDLFTGNKYTVETIEVHFLYNGDVEPEVTLAGFYVAKVKKNPKEVIDF